MSDVWRASFASHDGEVWVRVRPLPGGGVSLLVSCGADEVDVAIPAGVSAALADALRTLGTPADSPTDTSAHRTDGPAASVAPPIETTDALGRLRALNDLLPETAEVHVLDAPTFRVATRMFAAVEDHSGTAVVRFRATLDDQQRLATDPRYWADAETGEHGWTNVAADQLGNGSEFEALIIASYRLVAPDDLGAQVAALTADPTPHSDADA